MRRRIIAAMAALLATPVLADEPTLALKKDAGVEAVQSNCNSCHSLDYILMNSPYPSAQLWDAEITKMIKVFGAPIDDKDAAAIKAYLIKNYGS